ncbi:hypothetical protein ACFX2I_045192 [Malus domestica]
MTANASSFMFPWSPSPTHAHTHGMFSPRTEFSRNGLCNGVKNKQARPRWRSRGPTVPMVVGAVMMKLKWVFQLGDGAVLSRNGLGYFRCEVCADRHAKTYGRILNLRFCRGSRRLFEEGRGERGRKNEDGDNNQMPGGDGGGLREGSGHMDALCCKRLDRRRRWWWWWWWWWWRMIWISNWNWH